MKINRSPKYIKELFETLEYIAKDKISTSEKFKTELDELIDNLPNFPYKYRKSIYFNNENIRDIIFKGYTIVYRIEPIKKEIEILKIFNKNKPPVI
jgi:plasmid stabilization system protein ParE